MSNGNFLNLTLFRNGTSVVLSVRPKNVSETRRGRARVAGADAKEAEIS